ncbi:MAG: phosphate/phosphite/phosphonate ABC transporter substrate-binding protein [Desulfosoma sp.]
MRHWGTVALLCVVLLFPAHSQGDSAVFVDFSLRGPPPAPRSSPSDHTLRVAVGAMTSPQDTFRHYRELLDYVGRRMDRKVVLIQKKTYEALSRLFQIGAVDCAFVCSGSYVLHRRDAHWILLAAPQVMGETTYRSYLIVNKDSPYQTLADLRGKTFAFTDPHSNTGRLVPTAWVLAAGAPPERFFSNVIYTYSHDNSILAVAKGLVDGAAVDSLIWDSYQARDPTWTAKTKVIRRSEPFGIPPVVVAPSVSAQDRERLRTVFLTMHEEPEGRAILERLRVERFVVPQEQWYEGIEALLRVLKDHGIFDDAVESAEH